MPAILKELRGSVLVRDLKGALYLISEDRLPLELEEEHAVLIGALSGEGVPCYNFADMWLVPAHACEALRIEERVLDETFEESFSLRLHDLTPMLLQNIILLHAGRIDGSRPEMSPGASSSTYLSLVLREQRLIAERLIPSVDTPLPFPIDREEHTLGNILCSATLEGAEQDICGREIVGLDDETGNLWRNWPYLGPAIEKASGIVLDDRPRTVRVSGDLSVGGWIKFKIFYREMQTKRLPPESEALFGRLRETFPDLLETTSGGFKNAIFSLFRDGVRNVLLWKLMSFRRLFEEGSPLIPLRGSSLVEIAAALRSKLPGLLPEEPSAARAHLIYFLFADLYFRD